MSRALFSCPCCGTVGATSDYELEWFYDENDLEEIQTEFDEDTYSEAPEATQRASELTPTRQLHEPYKRTDEFVERIDERSVRETHVAGQRTQGLVVETIRNEVPAPQPQPRRQTRIAQTQALPTFNAVRPPRKTKGQLTDADSMRQGFEAISGDDPSQDCYEGLSGKELHQEQLLQAAYEADLRNRGFHSNESNFI